MYALLMCCYTWFWQKVQDQSSWMWVEWKFAILWDSVVGVSCSESDKIKFGFTNSWYSMPYKVLILYPCNSIPDKILLRPVNKKHCATYTFVSV